MKIAFIVERPTQFEAPFYRYVANNSEHTLRVIFTATSPTSLYDPELLRPIDWGFNLLGGYDAVWAPRKGCGKFFRGELMPGSADLVVVNGYTQRAYLAGVAAARLSGIPTGLRIDSVRFSGQHEGVRGWVKEQIFGQGLSRLFDVFFGVGSLTVQYLKTVIPNGRYALFPYAVDVHEFGRQTAAAMSRRNEIRALLDIPAAATVILSVAKFNTRETPWDLVRAFPRLSIGTEHWLVLAGDGPDKDALQKEARNLKIDRVRFPGYWPYSQLADLYASADLFVHPASEERWGVSVQEALACGLPVVASTRVGAAYDLILEGKNGFLFEAGDSCDLARKMSTALALPRCEVHRASAEVASKWDYAATWKTLVDTAKDIKSCHTPRRYR